MQTDDIFKWEDQKKKEYKSETDSNDITKQKYIWKTSKCNWSVTPTMWRKEKKKVENS